MKKSCLIALSIVAASLLGTGLKVTADPQRLSLAVKPEVQARSEVQADAFRIRQSLPVLQAILRRTSNRGRIYPLTGDRPTAISLLGNAFESGRSPQSSMPPRQIMQAVKSKVITVSEARVVQLGAPLGWLQTMTLKFGPDRQALTPFLDAASYGFSREWAGSSDRQRPD